MKKCKLSLAVLGLFAGASAFAANSVDLVNATPEEGQMVVQYQFLAADKLPEGVIATTIIPAQITLPDGAVGLRVLTMQNQNLPNLAIMPGGWFNFPAPGCNWTTDSSNPPVINFSITNHSISCK